MFGEKSPAPNGLAVSNSSFRRSSNVVFNVNPVIFKGLVSTLEVNHVNDPVAEQANAGRPHKSRLLSFVVGCRSHIAIT
jgi:hypothetical protein